MNGRTLVMGDVHGAHRAMLQVLDRSGFNRDTDRLIFLGDVVDGWPESIKCIDELMSIPNRVILLGNHDKWFADWVDGKEPDPAWVRQGGEATLMNYGGQRGCVPRAHRAYLRSAKLWHEEGVRMFVHAGWRWYKWPHPMACEQGELLWDRELWANAVADHDRPESGHLTRFREVFIGHTTTTRIGFTEPVQRCEVWNLDQGAGWEGKLSIMDVDTKEFWQSDRVSDLYPESAGRRRGGGAARLAGNPWATGEGRGGEEQEPAAAAP